jgi:hypothetical protein
MPAPLPLEAWAEIRRRWEFAPDAPSYARAAYLAGKAGGFKAPGRGAVHRRAKREGWARQGLGMDGVIEEAHLRADSMIGEGAASFLPPTRVAGDVSSVADAHRNAVAARDEAIDERASIIAKHRQQWETIDDLRSDALTINKTDPVEGFNRMKTAKITAETLTLQQAGERRAWSLDSYINITDPPPDFSKLTDEQLERIVNGKPL